MYTVKVLVYNVIITKKEKHMKSTPHTYHTRLEEEMLSELHAGLVQAEYALIILSKEATNIDREACEALREKVLELAVKAENIG